MSALRSLPWVRRTLTPDERAEMQSLPNDLAVHIFPSPVWSNRTWRCAITRANVPIADTSGHASPIDAFRQARAMLERREQAA